ncbi:MAG: N-acetylmuramic acid 6-phosphate etherase [Rhodobacteraceae bacterium]|nr:N-acetylmuramic acid 6-phosphate etherase [Paracoccaceae bacterium]
MLSAATEQLHPSASGLDERPLEDVAAMLIKAQMAAVATVSAAASEIAKGAQAMAQTLSEGGVLYYVAAGSSGLMAASDALELGGTFSIPAQQLRILMAGGLPTGVEMPGDTEDECAGLQEGLAELHPGDTVIAVSASGTTPYTLKAVEIARNAGAQIIGIANNPGSALLEAADIPIALPTPPELLCGSTRLGAGTAQKITLNTLSTAMAVALGHVHDGMMVNLRTDNAKLRGRAAGIVSRVASVDPAAAEAALEVTRGEVKLATLIAAHSVSLHEARARLGRANGRLRAALARTAPKETKHGDKT